MSYRSSCAQGAILPLGPVLQFIGELASEPSTLAC